MKISNSENEYVIIKELGERIKQYRISMNLTQVALAQKCGISISTEVRIESGEDTKFSNYIKILSALNLLDNMDLLVPEIQPDFKAIFDKKTVRKRVKSNHEKAAVGWVWGEDKEN